jgi:Carboxypeptidase regulatory-like domain/TonB dependent receptor
MQEQKPCRDRNDVEARRLRLFGTFLLVLALAPCQLAAQALSGSLTGNISDSSGAPVPGAEVKVMNTKTNEVRLVISNDNGGYSVGNLEAGDYVLTISRDGFQQFKVNNIAISIDSVSRINAELRVGNMTEQVTVNASAAGLQTDRSDLSYETSQRALQDLPTPVGRNYQAELRLVPGFSVTGGGAVRGSNPAAAFTMNVNGAPVELNNVRIDGATAANNFNQGLTAYVPGLEAIQTVEAVTNAAEAQTGLAGGASINVQIKSGTNQVHGSGFEFHTDNDIKARPAIFPAGQSKPKLIFNQFGGTIGGPIKHNKLFYFLSYDGALSRQGYSTYATVPSEAAKRGDLSESPTPIYDPATGNPDGSGRTQFPGNIIPASRISSISAKILPLWPTANQPGAANNYFVSASAPYNRHTVDGKVNYNVSNKLTVFGRIGFLDWNSYYEPVFGTQLGGVAISGQQSGPANGSSVNLTGAATYVVSPTFVVDGYFGFNRSYQNVLPIDLDQKIGTEFLGIPGTNGSRPFEGGWPLITLSGYNGVGVDQPYMPWIRHDPGYNYVTNATKNKGRHDIRFGFEFSRRNLNHAQPEIEGQIGGASGGFVFAQGVTQILGGPAGNRDNAFGAFLLGLPQQYGRTEKVPDQIQLRSNFFALYLQDRWSVSPRLTISYGVRWEYLPLPHRPDRGVEFYNPANNTQLICGYESVPSDCGVSTTKLGFSPRVGFAYRATDTLVIRAAFSIARDPYDIGPRGVRTNYPLMIATNYQGANTYTPAENWAQGIPTIVPPAYGNGIIPVPTSVVVHSIPQDLNRGYIESRNFAVQKEFGQGWIVQAGYVGTLIIRQFASIDLNAGQIPGAGVAGEQLFAAFGRTATTPQYRPYGSANYNALQTTVNHRFANGFQFGAAYTWSKLIGNTGGAVESSPTVQALSYMNLNRAVLSYDRTQVLNATTVWELPFGKGKRWTTGGFQSKLLGGWQINGILTAMTGLPFTVTASGTSLNMPGSTQFADQVSAVARTIGGTGPSGVWFDPTAFAPVTQIRFGNAAKNALRGPGLVNLDFGLFRDFRVTERFHLQFRGEAYNFTNTPHWGLPAANISAVTYNTDGSIKNLGGFGSITGTDGSYLGRAGMDERTFRLGLRMTF